MKKYIFSTKIDIDNSTLQHFEIGSVVSVKSMEICEKSHFFDQNDINNSVNHLEKSKSQK